MQISSRGIGWDQPPYVIAEIGVNHDGDMTRARTLVDAAAETGADAVKFQYFEADRLLSQTAKTASYQRATGEDDPFEMLRRLEVPLHDLAQLVDYAHERRLHAIVTIFSLEHVDSCGGLPWDAFKSASPDIVNLPLLRRLKRLERPMILSTGAANRHEIAEAIASFGDAALHCVSAYPTAAENAQLGGIAALWRLVDQLDRVTVQIGYSDHTTSAEMGGFAVAAGAVILEKHLTYDRTAHGPDHAASLDPPQFSQYVSSARQAWVMRGSREIIVQDIESDVRALSRQSITTTHAIDPGRRLVDQDLTIKRPGTGISPARWDEVLGRAVRHPVDENTPLRDEDLIPDTAE